MDIKLAQRVGLVKPSPTLSVSAKAAALRAEGRDILSLAAGEPDFDTPDNVKAAARRAIDEGQTKYTAVDGLPALKQAVIDKFRRENDLEYQNNEILVSCGAKHSIYNLMQALLNPGDEVIIPAPYWVSYPDMARLAGAEPVIIKTGLEQGFRITPEQLRGAISDRTRLLILNSPSNPTGACYSREELAALGEVLEETPDLLIASDDIYEHILWNGEGFVNIVNARPSLKERTIVINGVSKAYAMTGWRIGYAAGPARLIGAMKTIQSQSTSNPTSIAQYAAIEALNGDQSMIPEQCAVFRQRHDFVREQMNRIEGVTCPASDGTFYSFPNMQGVIDRMEGIGNDIELAEYLLEQAEVAMVPGSAFGAPGYMRLSFATSMEVLEQAMERLHKALV
ncbi:MAG: pyridoxal phosphate-dependent aminotransferase [Gammaproteobacteria bacterium]|nr:MAG: pyridoxal phosphate-dependent aminotransferase [Gammaproteobacteria bacterium]